ncbi:unnamed protein product [Brassicogethes aeneus]|uniref:THAP-type domain-containing protein n=1 Tax=Brassicogethes aeneus TaxID=1431903 RepID=A0A9P0ASV4_BRAAE|nr:unnamed protein product [Brassicogethes aeneus]
MGKCVVDTCDNRSSGPRKKPNVSFFKFPRDVDTKIEWVNLIKKRVDWIPTIHSSVCSDHFEDIYMYNTEKGYRKIQRKGVPTLNLPKYNEMPSEIRDEELNAKEDEFSFDDSSSHIESDSSFQEDSDSRFHGDDSDVIQFVRNTPKKRKLKQTKGTVKRTKNINNLLESRRRLQEELANIENILGSLQNEKNISQDDAFEDKAADEIIVPQPISIKVELEEACESHMDYDDTSEVLSDNFASEKETDKDIIVGESVVVKDEEPTEIIEKEFAEQCLDYAIKYFQQCTECNVAEEIIFLEKLKEKCPHLK